MIELVFQIHLEFLNYIFCYLFSSECVNDHMTPGGLHASVHVSVLCCGAGPPSCDVSLLTSSGQLRDQNTSFFF